MKLTRSMVGSLCCLLPLLVFSFFVNLPALPIRVFDEARNANTALEMYLHHNWLVPSFDGLPDMWNTKPPLLIWTQVAAMQLFGIGELAVRLPSAIASLATGLLLWAFCSAWCAKPWTGFLAGAVLASTYAYVVNHTGRTGDYDSMLTLFVTGYSLAAFTYARTGEPKWIRAFWILAALAALTKGVAGVLLLPAVVLFLIVERRFAHVLRDRAAYVGGLGFLVVVGGYYVLREHFNPGYWKAVLGNEIVGRYVEGLGSPRGSFFFYLDVIRRGEPYWIFFLPAAFVVGILSASSQIRKLTVFNLIAVTTFWLVISAGHTKLEWYSLPIFPFFSLQTGIALGISWERLSAHIGGSGVRRLAAPLVFVLVFYIPFGQVAREIFRSEEHPWDVELHAQAHFLQRSIRERSDLQNYVFCFRGYSGPASFYVKWLRAGGSNVQVRDRVLDLAPGTHVVVSQPDMRDEVEALYSVTRIGERSGSVVYTVLGRSVEEPTGHLNVLRATYGANCGAPVGNATDAARRKCDNQPRCYFAVDVGALGDPAPGCAKEFEIEWQCEGDARPRALTLRAEAGFGSVARLTCTPATR